MGDGVKIKVDIPSCKGFSDVEPLKRNPEDVTEISFLLGTAGYDMCRFRRPKKGIRYGFFKETSTPTAPAAPAPVSAIPVHPGPYAPPAGAAPIGISPVAMPIAQPMEGAEDDDFLMTLIITAGAIALGISAITAALVNRFNRKANVQKSQKIPRPGDKRAKMKRYRGPPPLTPKMRAAARRAAVLQRPIIVLNETVASPVRSDNIDGKEYVELMSVSELKDGDILPGHKFRLGEDATYNREQLKVNFGKDSKTHDVIVEAKALGERYRATPNTTPQMLADAVANMVDGMYSPSRNVGVSQNGVKTIGAFMVNGGVCRHRAALLQMALQEAGIKSRYVRGKATLLNNPGGYHAWVEIDLDGKGDYRYVKDPMNDISGLKVQEKAMGSEVEFRVDGTASIWKFSYESEAVNVVWRLKSQLGKAPIASAKSVTDVKTTTTVTRFVDPEVERTVEALKADPKANVEGMFDVELREWAQAINEYLDANPKAQKKHMDKAGFLKPGSAGELLITIKIERSKMKTLKGIARTREAEALKKAREVDSSKKGGVHDKNKPLEKAIK